MISSRIRNLCTVAILLVALHFSLLGSMAHAETVVQINRQHLDGLYVQGWQAYQNNNCIPASIYLFAYNQVGQLTGLINWNFLKQVEGAYLYCLERLQEAVATRQALLEGGNVVSVTVASGGKADDPWGQTVTRPFQMPYYSYSPRVELPRMPPQ